MSGVKKSAAAMRAQRPPRNTIGVEGDPTIPPAFSLACRSCGAPVGFDVADEGGVVKCSACKTVNVVPEEVTDGSH